MLGTARQALHILVSIIAAVTIMFRISSATTAFILYVNQYV